MLSACAIVALCWVPRCILVQDAAHDPSVSSPHLHIGAMDSLDSILFGDDTTPHGSPLTSNRRPVPKPSPGSLDFVAQAREWRKSNPGIIPGSPMSPGPQATPLKQATHLVEYYPDGVGLPDEVIPDGEEEEDIPDELYEEVGLTPRSSGNSGVDVEAILAENASLKAQLQSLQASQAASIPQTLSPSPTEAALEALQQEHSALQARSSELERSVEDLKAQLMEAMTPADNVPPPMDPAVDTLQHEKAALQAHAASLEAQITMLQATLRQLSSRCDSTVSHSRLLHGLYTTAAASRRAAYDQLWAHHANGSIRVLTRVSSRPQLLSPTGLSVTTVPGTSELCVRERGHSRTFAFDRVYDPSYPLPAALNDIDALAHCVLEGDNACVFLSTTPDLTSELANAAHHKALNCLFGCLLPTDDISDTVPSFRLTLSYVDVCIERATDMLSLSPVAASLDDPTVCLTVVESRKLDEAALVARTGVRRRAEAATNRGDSVSRSHGVLTICVVLPDVVSGKEISGKLHIVELASGIRAVSHDNGLPALPTDDLVADRSLSALTELACLVRCGSRIPSPSVMDGYTYGLSYGHSKLTTMLQDSFGNGKRSLMFLNIPEQLSAAIAPDALRALALGARVTAAGTSGSGVAALNGTSPPVDIGDNSTAPIPSLPPKPQPMPNQATPSGSSSVRITVKQKPKQQKTEQQPVLPPPPPVAPKDPVPGMKRLLMMLRRFGRFDTHRMQDLLNAFDAVDPGRTGRMNSATFMSALHSFAPGLSYEEVSRVVEAMHLGGAASIDYLDFTAALGVLAEADPSAPPSLAPSIAPQEIVSPTRQRAHSTSLRSPNLGGSPRPNRLSRSLNDSLGSGRPARSLTPSHTQQRGGAAFGSTTSTGRMTGLLPDTTLAASRGAWAGTLRR